MGFGGIGAWQLLIFLLIVALVVGTKPLRNVGNDLGSAVGGFRRGLSDDPAPGEVSPDTEPVRLENGRAADADELNGTSSAAS